MTTPPPTPSPEMLASLNHWGHYGRPGHPSEHRVLPIAWETKEFTKPVTTAWTLPAGGGGGKLTAAQVLNLVNGFQPLQMEDKWFIYSEGPDEAGKLSVNFFRSWTGFQFASILIQLSAEEEGGEGDTGGGGGGVGEVTALIWESDPARVRNQDFEKAKELVIGVSRWVLKVELPVGGS